MRQGQKRRRLLWAAAAILAALVAYGVVTAVRVILVYNDVAEARERLMAAEAKLRREGLDASPDSLARAEQQATGARSKFRSAHRFLAREPLLRVAERVPWVGSQISVAKDLTDIGYEGSEIGLAGVAALRAAGDVETDGETSVGESVMAYLDATAPMIAGVEERLSAIREKRDRIDTRWVLPPLADLVRRVDAPLARAEEAVAKYRNGRVVADHVLGFSGPRRYLVLGLDNTELLPGGGLVGMYGVVTFDQGRVSERSFGEVGQLIDRWQTLSGGEYVEPPAPLKRYLLRDWTWNFAVSDWSPDFPESARQAMFFYHRAGADPVDDVIAIDFAGLEGLLSVLGPTDVDGYGVTVSSDNVTEEILAHIGKPLRPQDGDHAFAGAVATEVIDGALAVEQDEWRDLLETLDRLADEKHLFLYAGDPRIQRSLVAMGWAGEVKDVDGDYLMAVNASVHSTKLNLVLDERVDMSVSIDSDGGVQNRVALRYENRLSEWARTRDPALVSGLMLSGLYGGYLRLLTPRGSSLVGVEVDGRAVSAEAITQEAGKTSFGRYFPLPRDSAATLTFVYGVPDAVDVSGGTREYRLLIQKQPGVRATPVRVAVTLPDGADVKSVSLEGRELPVERLEIDTDLSEDRELVVRYAP